MPAVIGKRHSISGQSTQLNSGGGSPDFSTQHPIVKRISTPLSSTIEEMAGSLESVNRTASSKQCSKALTFGEMSKKVFDLSCSNTSPTAAEKSTGNVGLRNHHGTDRIAVTHLDVRHESRCQVPEAPTRECAVPESLEDDSSKITVNGTCLGMLAPFTLLQKFIVSFLIVSTHIGFFTSCSALCFVFMYHKAQENFLIKSSYWLVRKVNGHRGSKAFSNGINERDRFTPSAINMPSPSPSTVGE